MWTWKFLDYLRYIRNFILFHIFTLMRKRYPMWFIQFLDGQSNPFPLSRDAKIQKSYEAYSEASRNAFIKNLFNKRLVTPEISYRFIPNDYPYFLEDGVMHYVLWLRPDVNIAIDTKSIRKVINQYILSKFNKPFDFYFFKNHKEIKSISEVEHYHVFIKKYDKEKIFTLHDLRD